MSGLNHRHYDRCDQGGSTEVRPEQQMSRLRRWPSWGSPLIVGTLTPAINHELKRQMTKKRRQRDKVVTVEDAK